MRMLVLHEVLLHRIACNKQCCRNGSRIFGRMLRTDECLVLHKFSSSNTSQSLLTEAIFQCYAERME